MKIEYRGVFGRYGALEVWDRKEFSLDEGLEFVEENLNGLIDENPSMLPTTGEIRCSLKKNPEPFFINCPMRGGVWVCGYLYSIKYPPPFTKGPKFKKNKIKIEIDWSKIK
ncbi:MAG: hypothetical protein ACTSQ8_07985 [Candidatus Helarchaeota archaeon]